jgi:hypothetical protein
MKCGKRGAQRQIQYAIQPGDVRANLFVDGQPDVRAPLRQLIALHTAHAITWKNKPLASLANMAAVRFQMRKLSQGKTPNPKVSPMRALIEQQTAMAWRTRQYRKWTMQRSKALNGTRSLSAHTAKLEY